MNAVHTALPRLEVEIDIAIAEATDRLMRVEHEISLALDSLHFNARDRKESPTRGFPARWQMTETEVRAYVPALAFFAQEHANDIVRLDSARARRATIEAEISELESACVPTSPFEWPSVPQSTETQSADEEPHSERWSGRPLFTQSTKTYCTGSGKRPEGWTGRQSRTTCPDCGKSVSTLRNGELRKHQADTAQGGN